MSQHIDSLKKLHDYLYAAMQLEHATIPPYLTALYTLKPGKNADAFHVLRVTVVEEMLHLTLAANLMNATGGKVDLTKPGFTPAYPAYLPDGEDDFQVSRRRFSREALETFLSIERPRKAPSEERRVLHRTSHQRSRLGVRPDAPEWQFYSIGEFYHEIWLGIRRLHKEYEERGENLFSGDRSKQITSEYFYSGGGEVIPVYDLDSAKAAIDLVAEQGEGFGGGIYDSEHELAHYYRFEQLTLGKYYVDGDTPGHPSGPALEVDWDASYPIKLDVTLADLPADSEVYAAAVDFNDAYADFLAFLTRAYGGEPELFTDAVVQMFRIKDRMTRLIHNPIPGSHGENAAPTFEVNVPAKQEVPA